MRIGIISEGHADRAVIVNLFTSFNGIDKNDLQAIRPIYNYDETDKALLNEKTFSTWSVVKKECETRELIDGFLALEGQDFVVIHLDTAEADEYGIIRPDRNGQNYCQELRALVINEINKWLKEDLSDQLLYAIAIEETEAWILTIYEKKDSASSPNPKKRLNNILSKVGKNSTSNYNNFLDLSSPFSKEKQIVKGKYLSYNHSLEAFYEEIVNKVTPKITE